MSIIKEIKKRAGRSLAILLAASMVLSLDSAVAFAAAADEGASVAAGSEEIQAAEEMAEEELSQEAEEVTEEVTGAELSEDISEAEETEEAEEEISEVSATSVSADEAAATEEEMALGAYADASIGITAAKAVFTKKNKLQISWKKGKEDKSFRVYPISKSGDTFATPLNGTFTTKTKLEVTPETLEDLEGDAAYAFKIVGYTDKFGQSESGYYSYVTATPTISQVQRHGDIALGYGRMEIAYTQIPGAAGYTIQRATKSNFKEIEDESVETELYKENYYDNLNSGQVLMRNDIDTCKSLNSNGKTVYYYRVKASVMINDLGRELESPAYSKAVGAKVTVRAPREGSISENDATSVTLSWEDMTADTLVTELDGDSVVERYDTTDQITTNDTYIIYASINGAAFKKIKTLKNSDLTFVPKGAKAFSGAQTFDYRTVKYELTGLKAEKDYVFKIAATKNKLTGAKSAGENLALHTELNDVDGMTFQNSNLDWIQVSWNKVPGATGFRIYYRELESETVAKAGLSSWNMSAASYVDVKNKVKDGKVVGTIPKLSNRRYYGIYVVALGNNADKKSENPQKSADSVNYIYAMTKISAPTVTVKQTKNSLKFSWKAVAKASGYKIEYVVGSSDIDNPVKIRDYKASDYDEDTLSYTINDLYIGEPVTVRITTIYTGDGATGEDKYGNNTTLYEALAPDTPTIIDTIYTKDDIGATVYVKRPSSTYENSSYTTEYYYRVYASEKKSKDYELIAVSANNALDPYNNSTSYNTVTDFSELENGKTRHYRVYLVAHTSSSVYDFDNTVVSRSYDYAAFCKATSVKASTVTITKGSEKDIELSFSPSATTVKEVKKWYVATGNSKTYDSELAIKAAGTVDDNNTSDYPDGVNRYKNDYIRVQNLDKYWRGTSKSGGYCYNDTLGSGLLAPKLRIKGIKKGTSYVKAVLSTGEEVTFKINVVESSSSSSSSGGSSSNSTVIVLDPGHGGSDGGCASGNLKESTINLKISKYTKEYLEEYGYDVYLTRSSDKAVDLDDRVIYAKGKGATAIVSQHINSGSGTGLECYYSLYYNSSTGKTLANNMLSYTVDKTGMSNRGAKTKKGDNGDYYAIIRYAASSSSSYGGKSIIGVIMENGFIQNDAGYMDSDSDLDKIAHGNARGIDATFK